MPDESRVQKLLDEIFDTDLTPEEVCGECPELLGEVRRRWQQMCAVNAELEALFPTPRPTQTPDTPTPTRALTFKVPRSILMMDKCRPLAVRGICFG